MLDVISVSEKKKISHQLFHLIQVRQKGRLDRQRVLAQKIVSQIKEVDFAKRLHQENLAATERERQSIIDNKLKPKGNLLLKK